jgi:hypothetical protein
VKQNNHSSFSVDYLRYFVSVTESQLTQLGMPFLPVTLSPSSMSIETPYTVESPVQAQLLPCSSAYTGAQSFMLPLPSLLWGRVEGHGGKDRQMGFAPCSMLPGCVNLGLSLALSESVSTSVG